MVRKLLRRLPEHLVNLGLQSAPKGKRKGSILCQAARMGNVDILDMLIKAGANLECEFEDGGTLLVAACFSGREDVMKRLVRAGAKTIGTKNGQACSALQAAEKYPRMVHWLLVEHHTDQKKLTAGEEGRQEPELRSWSGPRTAEVVIKDFYELTAGASLVVQATELSQLSRNLRGSVVMVRDLRF